MVVREARSGSPTHTRARAARGRNGQERERERRPTFRDAPRCAAAGTPPPLVASPPPRTRSSGRWSHRPRPQGRLARRWRGVGDRRHGAPRPSRRRRARQRQPPAPASGNFHISISIFICLAVAVFFVCVASGSRRGKEEERRGRVSERPREGARRAPGARARIEQKGTEQPPPPSSTTRLLSGRDIRQDGRMCSPPVRGHGTPRGPQPAPREPAPATAPSPPGALLEAGAADLVLALCRGRAKRERKGEGSHGVKEASLYESKRGGRKKGPARESESESESAA